MQQLLGLRPKVEEVVVRVDDGSVQQRPNSPPAQLLSTQLRLATSTSDAHLITLDPLQEMSDNSHATAFESDSAGSTPFEVTSNSIEQKLGGTGRRRQLQESNVIPDGRPQHKRQKSETFSSPSTDPLPPFLFDVSSNNFALDTPPLGDFSVPFTLSDAGMIELPDEPGDLGVTYESALKDEMVSNQEAGEKIAEDDSGALSNVYNTTHSNFPSLMASINPVAPPDYGY